MRIVPLLVFGFGFLASLGAVHAGGAENPGRQIHDESAYARRLITPEAIEGAIVWNRQGEEVGTVEKVVLDGREGRIAYVMVVSGGFWGFGGERVLIPWKAVEVERSKRLEALEQERWKHQPGLQQGIENRRGRPFEDQSIEPTLVVDVDRKTLENAPPGENPGKLDRRQAERIHRYFGVSPYWSEMAEPSRRP